MRVRGRRECKACGSQWSYYETGQVTCPECGSPHSVGVDDERSLHTATGDELDLAPIRTELDETPTRRLAERAAQSAAEYTRSYGFVDAGELQPLDDTYLAAMELRYVAAELARRMETTDDEELYFTRLLRADEGERPEPGDVPESLRSLRGLAQANAVRQYRSDLRAYLEESPDSAVGGVLERLSDHVKRVRALEGDVPPRETETLVAAARDVGRYLVEGDETALATSESRLDTLA